MQELIVNIAPNLASKLPDFYKALGDTMLMVLWSGLISFVFGLLLGVVLTVTKPNGILENKVVYQILDKLVSLFRSIPFIILLTWVMPITRALVGTVLYVRGAIVPLVFGSVPFFTRQVESALAELDGGLIEAALSMGSSPLEIIFRVYLKESIAAIADLLTHRSREYEHPIYLLADEPYRELVYSGAEVPFIPSYYPDTLYCYSFSKSLSLPGERVGFLALTPGMTDYALVRAGIYGAGRVLGYINVSSLFQRVCAECMGKTADLSVYAENRDVIYQGLTALGYDCVRPDGAFYLFVAAPDGDSQAFCQKAMAQDILLVPGDEFGCPGYARLAYCVELDKLRRSLPRFAALAREYGLKGEQA